MEKKIDINVEILTKELAFNIYELQSAGSPLTISSLGVINSYINLTSTICIVSRYEDKIIGFLIAKNLIDIVDLDYIYVNASYRKNNVAYSMFLKLAEFIKKSTNIKKIMLEVRISNIPAINLYKKLGFKIINTRKNYYKESLEDALVMEYIIL